MLRSRNKVFESTNRQLIQNVTELLKNARKSVHTRILGIDSEKNGYECKKMFPKCNQYEINNKLLLVSFIRRCTVKPKNARPLCYYAYFFKWLCQMLFGQYGVKFFHNIIGKLRFLRYYEKN